VDRQVGADQRFHKMLHQWGQFIRIAKVQVGTIAERNGPNPQRRVGCSVGPEALDVRLGSRRFPLANGEHAWQKQEHVDPNFAAAE
jgi:hypothetical protein